MSAQLIICLVIFALTIASFLIGKVSMAITSLCAMVLLVLTGCISAETALAGFSDSSTIIMASMFIISAGFAKTQMVTKISKWVARTAKGSFTYVMLGYIVVTALLAQIVPSAMAVFSIVFPLALGVCTEMNISPSKMIFSIGIVAISTICVLPFGAGAVYVSQFNGILSTLGSSAQYGFADICVARLPGMLFVMAYAIFVAPKFAPDKPVVAVQDLRPASAAGGKEAAPALTRAQEVVGYLVFFGVILGLIVTSLQLVKVPFQVDAEGDKVALESCIIPLIGAIVMVAAGILKPKEAYGSIGMGGMVMVYIGVLALANALTATGAGNAIGDFIASIFGSGVNGYVLGFVFFIVPFVLTQVMMNWAVLNVFAPIAILTCGALGANPLGPTVLVVAGSLTAFMTPLATPSAAVMMGLGGYDQKTMFKMGWLPALCLCVVNVGWVMTVMPAF